MIGYFKSPHREDFIFSLIFQHSDKAASSPSSFMHEWLERTVYNLF